MALLWGRRTGVSSLLWMAIRLSTFLASKIFSNEQAASRDATPVRLLNGMPPVLFHNNVEYVTALLWGRRAGVVSLLPEGKLVVQNDNSHKGMSAFNL